MSESQTLKQKDCPPHFPHGVCHQRRTSKQDPAAHTAKMGGGGSSVDGFSTTDSSEILAVRYHCCSQFTSRSHENKSSTEPPTQECPEKRKQHQLPNTNGNTLTSVAAPYGP